MDSNVIIALLALAYGAFLGYCLGRYHGYTSCQIGFHK
jgi:hypothetical protein